MSLSTFQQDRRRWLARCAAGAITTPVLLPAAQRPTNNRPPCSAIVIFLTGAPSQFETWDPKPEAPLEIRGESTAVSTSLPGVFCGEWLPRTARWMHELTLVRSMHTGDNAHSTSGYAMHTGVAHRPLQIEGAVPGPPNNWPSLGGVVRHLRPSIQGLPSAVTVPEWIHNDDGRQWPGQQGGFLGQVCDPWLVPGNAASDDFRVPDLTATTATTRYHDRLQLLQRFEQRYSAVSQLESAGWDAWRREAETLLGSPQAEVPFQLQREHHTTRDRYGRSQFGQSVLLARRLVEAGVSLVQVNWTRLTNGAPNNGHWDTHTQNAVAHRDWLLPPFDQAYTALLEDLTARGLWDSTIVAVLGEFGRTPRINVNGGRDHWGNVFSIALAGGPFRRGMVYGASDRLGAEPVSGPMTPADFTATLYHALGLAPTTQIVDLLGRPFPLSSGHIIRDLLT